MTIYILKVSTDYGSDGWIREPFANKADAVKQFNKYKKIAMEDDGDLIDPSRLYHIQPEENAEGFITKYVIRNKSDLIRMIKTLNSQ
jgi:endo-1,4-beta-D-glucanase Y